MGWNWNHDPCLGQNPRSVCGSQLQVPSTTVVTEQLTAVHIARSILFCCIYYYVALLPRRGRILRRTLSVCLSQAAEACIKLAGRTPKIQKGLGRSKRRGQKPLSTFHLEVVNFVYFEGHFAKFVFQGQTIYYMLVTKIMGQAFVSVLNLLHATLR